MFHCEGLNNRSSWNAFSLKKIFQNYVVVFFWQEHALGQCSAHVSTPLHLDVKWSANLYFPPAVLSASQESNRDQCSDQ